MAQRSGQTLAQALRRGTQQLAQAGVPAPEADALQLAGHLLGLERGEVAARAIIGAAAPEGLDELLARRAAREPLQHIVGTAPFRRLEIQVGPGVFIPRPETELLVELLVERLREEQAEGDPRPVVVDLCTGSGAIAAAIADEVPHARVHAIELDPRALTWARRNLEGRRVDLRAGDATQAPEDLRGRCAAVVTNPPYVPAVEPITQPEVLDHDPAAALWGGGDDGMEMPRRIIAAAAQLLRPGGWCVLEHAESQAPAIAHAFRDAGFDEAEGHADLTGRPRATTGVLRAGAQEAGVQQ